MGLKRQEDLPRPPGSKDLRTALEGRKSSLAVWNGGDADGTGEAAAARRSVAKMFAGNSRGCEDVVRLASGWRRLRMACLICRGGARLVFSAVLGAFGAFS